MESKRLLKISWICLTLFLGIIIYFNIHPIPTLIKPGLTITIKNSDGGFFNTTNSVKNLEDAENNFYVKFNIKKLIMFLNQILIFMIITESKSL